MSCVFLNIELKFICEGIRDWYMILKRIKFSRKTMFTLGTN